MARDIKKCPKCGGNGKRISGKVMLIGTHCTYGYGERAYECRKCKYRWSSFYPIPPKSGMYPQKPGEPPDGFLRPRWLESIRGHAYSLVIGADVPESPGGLTTSEPTSAPLPDNKKDPEPRP